MIESISDVYDGQRTASSYHMKNTNDRSSLVGKSGSVLKQLEARFAGGRYKFGQILSPAELAEEFGVSMQPLRAALGQLRALGFIAITPQVGCRVVSPSPDDIRDFFKMFGRMEGVMASLAAQRHAAPELLRLEVIQRSLYRCKTNTDQHLRDYALLVGDWHAEIRNMARSTTLAERSKTDWNMADFIMWQGAPTMSEAIINIASIQRTAIIDAISMRDAAKAEQLMFEYVRDKPIRGKILE